MNIIYEAQALLEQAGYFVELAVPDEVLHFEDESLYGFVRVFGSAAALVSEWAQHQDSFLEFHAAHIRAAPEKAWNAYSVLLTSAEALESNRANLLQIEEDFRGSRKIAKAHVASVDDLRTAMQPLLPIESKVALRGPSGPNLSERLTSLSADETESLMKQDLAQIISAIEQG